MESKAAAFEEVRSSLRRLGIPDILPGLHAVGISINRAVLGGSHSVAVYPPIDSLTPLDSGAVLDAIDCGSDASLYVHVAFCETRCTFCHYAVEHYAGSASRSQPAGGRVTRYLEALQQELTAWGLRLARSATRLSSIYIGGGTPLVLEQDALGELIKTIRGEFDIVENAEVCIEGSPLTITAPDGADKLRFMKAEGVTRLSFGVQSFDDMVLQHAARGYQRDVAIRASQIASEIFENWNLDLIQGLYRGTPSETWDNLNVIAEIRPAHLTWYHGRFADRPQGSWYRSPSKRAGFEDEYATLFGRMLIWQEMRALGYHQIDGNRFAREQRYVDPFKAIRTSASDSLLGVGAASYSHVGVKDAADGRHGYMFRNITNIPAYANCVLSGDSPIATGRIMNGEEVFAASFATGLRSGRIESDDLRAIRSRHPGLSSHYDDIEIRLRDVGILESYAAGCGQTGTRMSELGRLFEDETLSLFFSPAVQRTLAMGGASPHRLVMTSLP